MTHLYIYKYIYTYLTYALFLNARAVKNAGVHSRPTHSLSCVVMYLFCIELVLINLDGSVSI